MRPDAQRSGIAFKVLAGMGGAVVLAAIAFLAAARVERDVPGPQLNATPARTDTARRADGSPTTAPVVVDDRPPKEIPTTELFARVAQTLGVSGQESEGTYTVLAPRRDQFVLVGGNEVPTAAGVRHTFHFYRCPCGTLLVHGEYLLLEHEVNDVIDSLREDPEMKVVGLSPFLIDAEPRLTVLRFQGEAEATALATSVRRPFRWIGDNRSAANPTDQIPQ